MHPAYFGNCVGRDGWNSTTNFFYKEVFTMRTTYWNIILQLSEWYAFLLAGWYLSKWYYEEKEKEKKIQHKK